MGPPLFDVQEIDAERAHLLEAAMGTDGHLVAPRFARGCRCFAAWIDGRVGGYGWLSTREEWIGELDLEIHPRDGEGYVWNCATLAEHRRKGVFRSLLVGVSEIARNEGLKRLWIGSVAIPAEKALAPAGFQPGLHFTTLRFAGLQCREIHEPRRADAALILEARKVLGLRETRWHREVSIRRSWPRTH